MNKLIASSAALILCAGAGTAFAIDLNEDGYDDDTGEPIMAEETTEETTNDTTSSDPKPAEDGGKYKMGISVPLIGIDFGSLLDAGIRTADLLWAMGDNWLDIGVGVRIESLTGDPGPPIVEARTSIGFEIDVGYRMMKPTKGRVMPFLKPFVQFGILDFEGAGDNIILGAGATLGVDVMVFEQFTLGAEIGAGLRTEHSFNSDLEDSLLISTGTSALNATIWW